MVVSDPWPNPPKHLDQVDVAAATISAGILRQKNNLKSFFSRLRAGSRLNIEKDGIFASDRKLLPKGKTKPLEFSARFRCSSD